MPNILTGYASLKGSVLGYSKNQFTRGIENAQVFIKIHIADSKKRKVLPDKKLEFVYDTLNEKDLVRLSKDYPEVYEVFYKHREIFGPRQTDIEGNFEFQEVPIGFWCYILSTYVDGKERSITDKPFGNNGFGKSERIQGEHLQQRPRVDEIIIPVEDDVFKKSIAKPKKDDPPTNTAAFIPGVRKEE